MAEVNWKVTSESAVSDTFDFEWTVQTYLSDVCCQELFSKLSGGIKFRIIVYRCDSGVPCNQNSLLKMKVVMKENAENCAIKTFLFFEIRNQRGQLYLKDSMEKLFSYLNQEHESDGFKIPFPNQPVYYQGRNRSQRNGLTYFQSHERGNPTEVLYFDDQNFLIKGSVIFQCCEEKNASEPLCKNISQLQSDLMGLLHSKFYADIKFTIDNDVIPAHKNILCSRSAVFRKMFEQNMKEKEGSAVRITDIEKPVFEVFLNFLYTGIIQDNTLDVVMPLYSVADKYAVETLLNTCSNLLVSYITDKTVALILKLADMHNDATLKAAAIDYICKNFAEVEITDSWDTLLNSDPRLASYALKQVSVSAAKSVSGAKAVTKNVPELLDGAKLYENKAKKHNKVLSQAVKNLLEGQKRIPNTNLRDS